MLRAYFYDADGHDREVEFDAQCLEGLDERTLLWVDIEGRERRELEHLATLLQLDQGSVRELLTPQEALYLDNYGEYFQFDVVALSSNNGGDGERAIRKQSPVHLEFLVGPRWIVTVHEGELTFLEAFRNQDKGETLIGALSPPAFAASLLDWHLTSYFEAIAAQEAFLDRIDEAMLSRAARKSLLVGVVAMRRRVSELRRWLASQRPVFYGLSRPDFAHVVQSDAAAHYASLERRYERAVDSIDHARDLVNGSFELFTTRTAESTNDLVRRLTFITMLLGVVGAVAGIFGMNFDAPFARTGALGFWSVIGGLGVFVGIATVVAHRNRWL
jgi:magnesium transporter